MAGKKNTVSAKKALDTLKQGNARFSKDKPVYERHDREVREHFADHQVPYAIILSCADSRVIPELVFDTGIGDLFVVRVAGNVANTSTIASIEYAVSQIGTKLIVVLGHEACGAVTAALNGGSMGYNLNHLLAHISPAVDAVNPKGKKPDGSMIASTVRKNAKLTAAELEGRSDIIRKAKGVSIVPAYYELGSGKVKFL